MPVSIIIYIFGLCLSIFSVFSFADTRSLNFDTQNNTLLDGTWHYFPAQFSTQNSNLAQDIHLPNSFANLSGQLSYYGTFTQHFSLPPHAIGEPIAIYIPYQYGAYTLFINDVMRLKAGKVGIGQAHETQMTPKLITFVSDQAEFKLTFHVSSYQQIRGGLENSMLIGYEQPIRQHLYQNILLTTWVSGMLVMIALFMLLFAIYRLLQGEKNASLLFLALFVLCLSLRTFFAVPFSYTLFTSIGWVWGTRFEYLLTELVCLFFLTYLFLALKHFMNRVIYYVLAATILINIGVTLTQPPVVFQQFFFQSFTFSLLLFLNALYGVYRLYRDKTPFSKVNAAAIFVVLCTFFHDFLLGLNVIDSVEIAFYTSCLYFVIVTIQLSRDYAIQSDRAISSNRELKRLNRSLDQQVSERTATVVELNTQLQRQLKQDALTGAYNRFALNEEIQQRFEHAQRHQNSLAFFMIDVDYFKAYNDHYGHLKGDDVLRGLVEILQSKLPENGFLARYGGEEFAIILDQVDVIQAQAFAEQCLAAVLQAEIPHLYRLDDLSIVSVSIGGALLDNPNAVEDVLNLMKSADQHLYVAKEQRASVVVQ